MKKKEELLQEKDSRREGCLCAGVTGALLTLLWAAAWVVCILLTGCKTEYVTVEKVVERRDTLRHSRDIRDSIYVHDSIYASEHRDGDTVRITTERWHTQWRDRWLHDTAYVSKTDSVAVPVPYPVEVVKEVEKPLKWWQKGLMWIGALAVLVAVCALALRWKKVF